MRTVELDAKIRELAARQLWLFNRNQATALGASERFIARRVAQRAWVRHEQTVYGLTGHPLTWKRRLKACELGARGSAIGGIAAAALHGFTDFRPCRPHLIVPPGVSGRGKTATLHRQVGFPTTVVEGITVTTIPQTLFDIAPVVGLWRLERALDDLLVGGRMKVSELEERLRFYAGSRRKGLPRMRALTDERSAHGWVPPESELEALLFVMLARVPGGPTVVRQPALPWRTRAEGRVDGYLPDHGIICEGDSRRWHSRVADFDRDRWRDNQAAAHGLRVMRFTWLHLTAFVDECVALVDQAVRTHRAA